MLDSAKQFLTIGILSGSYEFSLSEAFKLSRLLGVTIDELYTLAVS